MITFAHLIEPPFNDRDRDGRVVGCDIELARTVAEAVGERLDLVEVDFAQLVPGLVDGRWRMTTGLFATRERRWAVAFSRPIWALPDGLLVRRDGPTPGGYRAVARSASCRLAVVRDQVQHGSALSSGVPAERILVFDTYAEAARAVAERRADAFASVAKAHAGHLARGQEPALDIVTVRAEEGAPAFGCFGLAPSDRALHRAVDGALASHLGSAPHRAMMGRYGFSDAEVDLVAP